MRRMKFPDEVGYEPCTSIDEYGTCAFGEKVTLKCSIEYVEKNIKDLNDNEFMTSAWIAFHPTVGSVIKRYDRITLPDNSQQYIGSIAQRKNKRLKKITYIEVYVGRVAPGEGVM